MELDKDLLPSLSVKHGSLSLNRLLMVTFNRLDTVVGGTFSETTTLRATTVRAHSSTVRHLTPTLLFFLFSDLNRDSRITDANSLQVLKETVGAVRPSEAITWLVGGVYFDTFGIKQRVSLFFSACLNLRVVDIRRAAMPTAAD